MVTPDMTLKLGIRSASSLAFFAVATLVGAGGNAVRIKRLLGSEGSVVT